MFKRKTLLSLVAVSSLALNACGTTDDTPDFDDATPPVVEQEDTTTEKPTDDVSNEENVTMDPVEAFDIFLDQYPNAKVTEIELENNNETFLYKVEGFDGNEEYKLKISASDGEIIKESMETDDDNNDGEITREHVEKVLGLIDEAILDAGDDFTLDEWVIEMNDGIPELEIELDSPDAGEIEYKYNLKTGKLIEKD